MKKTAITTIVLSLVVIPASIFALREVKFDIYSTIKITDRCYTLDTTYGSFDTTKDVKAICVPFSNNKYVIDDEAYSYLWGDRKSENDTLVLTVEKEHLTDSSYVRVYDENDKLIIEVKKSDFPKPLFHVEDVMNYDHYDIERALGTNYDRENVRLEVSEDLEAYEEREVAYFMYVDYSSRRVIKGPWISDSDAIEQIYTLDSYSNSETTLTGFVRDTKDSHLYHAVWKVPSNTK